MKVIFLDFDGVINDYLTINEINAYNVKVLKQIIEETDAKVVITSSHKYKWQWQGIDNVEIFLNSFYPKYLIDEGIDVIDWTPYLRSGKREEEILAYLGSHPEITQYVILDDDYILETLKEHEIFLDAQSGLREKHIAPAIRILNGQLEFYHDCTDEQLSEDSDDRLIRMNEILHEILKGKLDFYGEIDEEYRKVIEARIRKLNIRFNKGKKASEEMER